MAEIRPFRALRYNLEQAGSIQELTCPPYDMAAADYWAGFDTVLLRGMQFHFTPAMLERRFDPEELAEYTRELTAAHARRMDEHLRALYPGAAVLTTGGCTLCEECTRPMGRPCRHPQAVGYSLESLGCDVGAAARGELGWELLWPRRDRLPRYLTLLCAVLRLHTKFLQIFQNSG